MMRKYRRSTKRDAEALAALFGFGLIAGVISLLFKVFEWLYEIAREQLSKPVVWGSLSAVGFLTLCVFVAKRLQEIEKQKKLQEELEEERQKLLDAIHSVAISDDRHDYIIEGNDYKRGNKKERDYRKMFKLSLLGVYDNKCAKCGEDQNGIDIDHFFLSKNAGGCFIMRHKGGYLVNNAVPLCQTCNRAKSDKHFRSFFSDTDLLHVLQRNVVMTRKLNDNLSDINKAG